MGATKGFSQRINACNVAVALRDCWCCRQVCTYLYVAV